MPCQNLCEQNEQIMMLDSCKISSEAINHSATRVSEIPEPDAVHLQLMMTVDDDSWLWNCWPPSDYHFTGHETDNEDINHSVTIV